MKPSSSPSSSSPGSVPAATGAEVRGRGGPGIDELGCLPTWLPAVLPEVFNVADDEPPSEEDWFRRARSLSERTSCLGSASGNTNRNKSDFNDELMMR
ncbi:hypothetical protein PpBr36_08403 [Pyricularia pennisetigena]|uniref:hypothetical protein n=1 Tax=Pyricularia pennisetigena TaxID=1578925 RepID=UPI001150188F|nr:hypothetical protein PpBr36_08403 [Pyricularia pennisetigena]TLS24287.1 hypothetical protein PpBr36_08403 [Pyricularia pennisetigena]